MEFKKKAILLHDAPLDEWKGSQRIFLEYGNFLVNRGYDVTYISPSQFNRPEGERKIRIEAEVKFKVETYKFRHLFIYWVPRKLIKEKNPELIYVGTFNSFPIIPIGKRKLIFGSFVYGPENDILNGLLQKLWVKFKRFSFRLAMIKYSEKSVVFQALNKEQADWLRKIVGDRFKIFNIPPPVDCSRYFFSKNQENSDEIFKILFVGPLTVDKGFQTFSEIIDRLNSSEYGKKVAFYVLSAGGPLEGLLKSILARWNNIRYVVSPTETEKIDYYRVCQVLISPSKVENFHIVAAEAQLCGLPVISSKISGPSSIIIQNRTGVLVPMYELEGYIDGVLHYLDLWKNKEAYTNLKIEISSVSQRFCSERSINEFLNMLTYIQT